MEVASAPAAAVEAGLDRVSGLKGGESGVVESAAVESRVEESRDKGTARSAWRNPAPPPAADTGVAAGEGRKTEGPVMGAESWPALKDAMRKDHPDSKLNQAPAPAVSSAAQNVGDAADNVPLHPRPLPSQGSGGLPKSDSFGNSNPSSRHHTQHHHKLGPKHAPSPNNTPFPTHLTYHQPIPPFLPPIVPGPPLPLHEYGYQPYPPPFPSVEPRMVSSGCGTPMQAFIPPIPPRGVDANRSFPPPPRGDPNVWHNHGGNYSRRHNAQESACRFNPSWRQQRVFGPRENVNMQQNMGPKTFVRPVLPVFGPVPGYMGGPGFPGPAPMCYIPLPSEVVRGPSHYMSVNPSHPGHPILQPEAITLGNSIIAQIEYYFSDENLQDSYLLSLLDSEGWVPVAKIADFNRVKNMTTNIPFILEALQSSNLIEVQGEKIRRRGDWSKWLSLPGHQASTAKAQASEVQVNNIADDMEKESNDSRGKGEQGLLKISEDEGIKGQLVDASNIELKSTSGCTVGELLTPDRSKEYSQETRDSNGKSVYVSSSESKGTETGDGCNRMPAHQSVSKKFGGLSNAFANEPSNSSEQSTFMLDEELEFDHPSIQRDAMSSQKSHVSGKRPRAESQQDDDPRPAARPRSGEESPTPVDVSTPPETRAAASFSSRPGDVLTEAGLEVDESIPDISLDIEGLEPPTDDYTPVTGASPVLDIGGISATQGLENLEVRLTIPIVEEGCESSVGKGTSSSLDSSSGGSSSTSSSTGTSGTSSNGGFSSFSSSTSEEGEIRMSPATRSTSSLDELSRLMESGPSTDLPDYYGDVRAPNTGIGVPDGVTPPLAVGPLAGTVGVAESCGMQASSADNSEGRSALQPEGVDMAAGSPQALLEEQDTADQGVASAEPSNPALSPSAEPATEVDTAAIGEDTRIEIESSAAPVSPTKQGSAPIDISPPVLEEGSSFRSDPTSRVTSGLVEGGVDVPQDFPAFGVEWPNTPQLGVVLADVDTAGRLLQGLEQLIRVNPLPTVEALSGNLEAFTRSYQMLGLPRDAWAARMTALWSEFTRLHIAQEQRRRTKLMIQQEERLDRLRVARMEVEARATVVRERDQAVSLRVEVLQREMHALLQQTQEAEEERNSLQAEVETLRCRLEGLQEETIQSEARLADLRRSEPSA